MRRRVVLLLGLATVIACGPGGTLTLSSAGAAQTTPKGPMGSEDNPVRVSGGVMAGLILTKVDPEYPEDAKSKKISGAVVMMAKVDKEGRVAT